jgi:hypothetical protein
VILTDGPRMVLTPTYHVFDMYRVHFDAPPGVWTLDDSVPRAAPNVELKLSACAGGGAVSGWALGAWRIFCSEGPQLNSCALACPPFAAWQGGGLGSALRILTNAACGRKRGSVTEILTLQYEVGAMSKIRQVYAAMLTRNTKDSGTRRKIVLIANIYGIDRLHYTFPPSSQMDQIVGQANLYRLAVAEAIPLDTQFLSRTYFRIAIRGSDLWRPEHFFIWGTVGGANPIVPMALGLDLRTSGVQRGNRVGTDRPLVLSGDEGKGDVSFSLSSVNLGGGAVPIRRLLVIMSTADRPNAGTNSALTLQVAGASQVIVTYNLPDTPQEDQERGQANWYFVPIPVEFKKNSLGPSPKVTLTIAGTDAWLPASIMVFGLDSAEGHPAYIVPLVHVDPWALGWLSSDPNEGKSTIELPVLR